MDLARLESRWGERVQRIDNFMKRRDEYSILIPFEYGICIFRKLRVSTPVPKAPQDELLRACIQRMNLDAF